MERCHEFFMGPPPSSCVLVAHPPTTLFRPVGGGEPPPWPGYQAYNNTTHKVAVLPLHAHVHKKRGKWKKEEERTNRQPLTGEIFQKRKAVFATNCFAEKSRNKRSQVQNSIETVWRSSRPSYFSRSACHMWNGGGGPFVSGSRLLVRPCVYISIRASSSSSSCPKPAVPAAEGTRERWGELMTGHAGRGSALTPLYKWKRPT